MKKILVKIDPDLQDIVPGFIEKRKNELPILKEYLAKKDFNSLQTIGHRLKGNSGGYGFDHMGIIGASIEISAKAQDILKIESSLKELENYLLNLEIVYEES